jgi:hypothetical protein
VVTHLSGIKKEIFCSASIGSPVISHSCEERNVGDIAKRQ